MRMAIAVLLSATSIPSRIATGSRRPNALAAAVVAPSVSETWSAPPVRRKVRTRDSSSTENSMPTVNRSRMTPISASASTCSTPSMSPNPNGPQSSPVTRNPTMGGSRARWNTTTTRTPRPKMRRSSWRRCRYGRGQGVEGSRGREAPRKNPRDVSHPGGLCQPNVCPSPYLLAGRAPTSRQGLVFRNREGGVDDVRRTVARERTQPVETPRIDPVGRALPQQRVALLAQQLIHELRVGAQDRHGARSEPAGRLADEVDVTDGSGLVAAKPACLRAQEDQLLVLDDRDWRRGSVVHGKDVFRCDVRLARPGSHLTRRDLLRAAPIACFRLGDHRAVHPKIRGRRVLVERILNVAGSEAEREVRPEIERGRGRDERLPKSGERGGVLSAIDLHLRLERAIDAREARRSAEALQPFDWRVHEREGRTARLKVGIRAVEHRRDPREGRRCTDDGREVIHGAAGIGRDPERAARLREVQQVESLDGSRESSGRGLFLGAELRRGLDRLDEDVGRLDVAISQQPVVCAEVGVVEIRAEELIDPAWVGGVEVVGVATDDFRVPDNRSDIGAGSEQQSVRHRLHLRRRRVREEVVDDRVVEVGDRRVLTGGGHRDPKDQHEQGTAHNASCSCREVGVVNVWFHGQKSTPRLKKKLRLGGYGATSMFRAIAWLPKFETSGSRPR